jgi:hypothetical protein
MAAIKQPITDIMSKLATLNIINADLQTVPLRVRVWNNQLRHEAHGEMYDFIKPAAFLEVIGNVQWEQLGIGFRSADIGFHVHLITEMYDAQDGTMEQNLKIFDLRDQVVAMLSNYAPTACSPMWSTGETQDYDHTNLYHYIISFVCNFTDSKGSQYEPGAGYYIDSTPPTNLVMNVVKQ